MLICLGTVLASLLFGIVCSHGDRSLLAKDATSGSGGPTDLRPWPGSAHRHGVAADFGCLGDCGAFGPLML